MYCVCSTLHILWLEHGHYVVLFKFNLKNLSTKGLTFSILKVVSSVVSDKKLELCIFNTLSFFELFIDI